MGFKTIKQFQKAEYEEKKSIFIGSVQRVETEEEAKAFIAEVKANNREAKHNVFAYVIGENMGIQRYSDDGEPQGTGGIPVLEVIKKNNITNVVIVVTRYFGGVLLGAAGLCRAYSKAAAMAVKDAGTVEKVNGIKFNVKLSYDMLGKVEYYFNQNNWQIDNIEYSENVQLEIKCEENTLQDIEKALINLTSNNVEIINLSKQIFYKEEQPNGLFRLSE